MTERLKGQWDNHGSGIGPFPTQWEEIDFTSYNNISDLIPLIIQDRNGEMW